MWNSQGQPRMTPGQIRGGYVMQNQGLLYQQTQATPVICQQGNASQPFPNSFSGQRPRHGGGEYRNAPRQQMPPTFPVFNQPTFHSRPTVRGQPAFHGQQRFYGRATCYGQPTSHGQPTLHGHSQPTPHSQPTHHGQPISHGPSTTHYQPQGQPRGYRGGMSRVLSSGRFCSTPTRHDQQGRGHGSASRPSRSSTRGHSRRKRGSRTLVSDDDPHKNIVSDSPSCTHSPLAAQVTAQSKMRATGTAQPSSTATVATKPSMTATVTAKSSVTATVTAHSPVTVPVTAQSPVTTSVAVQLPTTATVTSQYPTTATITAQSPVTATPAALSPVASTATAKSPATPTITAQSPLTATATAQSPATATVTVQLPGTATPTARPSRTPAATARSSTIATVTAKSPVSVKAAARSSTTATVTAKPPVSVTATARLSASSGQTSSSCSGQMIPSSQQLQAKQAVMAVWLERIKEWYPDRYSNTHFLPPQHFHRVQYGVTKVGEQKVLVPEKAPKQVVVKKGPLCPTLPAPPGQGTTVQQVAGKVWTQPYGPSTSLLCCQETDVIDDAATEHVLNCLRALGDEGEEAMMVISKLEFRKYLDGRASPMDAADCALFPRPDGVIGPRCRGECDLIILHRNHGIIVGEIKAVGAEMDQIMNLDEAILKRVKKSVSQLNTAAEVACHVVSDVAKVKVTKTLILPFIQRSQLKQALSGDRQLQEEFRACLDAKDVSEAVDRCLCKDDMPNNKQLLSRHRPPSPPRQEAAKDFSRMDCFYKSDSSDEDGASLSSLDGSSSCPSNNSFDDADGEDDDDDAGNSSEGNFDQLCAWWQHITIDVSSTDVSMTDDVYDQLLARFCGPCTTVQVPTVTAPGRALTKVLRTPGQAAAETGLILSTLTLYPQQVDILTDSSLGCVHLGGPPGVGKTLLLTLKASQWLHEGHTVHLLQGNSRGRAVTMVIENQLRYILDPALGSQVRRHVMSTSSDEEEKAAAKLKVFAQDGNFFLIIDEVSKCLPRFLEKLKAAIPKVNVWCAGTSSLKPCPDWMTEKILDVPLRSPPVVNREVGSSGQIRIYRNILPYSSADTPAAPMDGPPIRWIKHKNQDGHDSFASPVDCGPCGLAIVQQLKELGVGKAGADELQYRDVLIVCPSHKLQGNKGQVTLLTVLQDNGFPVALVTTQSPDSDVCSFALASDDKVVVADQECVHGLERRVVIGMGNLVEGRAIVMSRCIAQVVWIDKLTEN